MNASRYFDAVSNITGAKRLTGRLASIVGSEEVTALVPASVQPSFTSTLAKAKAHAPHDVRDTAGTAAGAVAGAVIWREHRVLGAIGGASLGRNIPGIFRGADRRDALCNMANTGAAIAGSLIAPSTPIVGFTVGYLIGGAVIYFGGLRK